MINVHNFIVIFIFLPSHPLTFVFIFFYINYIHSIKLYDNFIEYERICTNLNINFILFYTFMNIIMYIYIYTFVFSFLFFIFYFYGT